MFYQLSIKQAYDFVLQAPAILGAGYKQATVMSAAMDYESAKGIDDVMPLHNAAYSSLTGTPPRNARDLTYVKIKTTTGEIRVFAMEWLASEPVLVASQTVQITVQGVSLDQISTIKNVLIQNGFPNITAVAVL